MTQPHNGSPFQSGTQNPQQSSQQLYQFGPNGAEQHDPYRAHQAGPYGAGANTVPAFAEPQEKSSSAAMWVLLAVIVAMVLLLGAGFFLVRGFFDNYEEDTQVEAAPLAPLEGLPDDYFDRSLSIERAEKIREGDLIDAPVPEELSGLTDTCVQGASYFGGTNDPSGMVPTITCIFGENDEFSVNYTRNKDAIAAAAKTGKELKEQFGVPANSNDIFGKANQVKTTRGSMLSEIHDTHEGETEYVMSEVLAGETAVIEYISTTSEVLLRQPLVDAGIVERDRNKP